MGAWMRSAIRTPHATLVLAMLSQLLPAPAFALAARTAAMRESVHEVYVDSGTIQAAIELAVDGDTILVGPGVYRERIDLLGKAITIQSEAGAEYTLIDGTPVSKKDPGGSTVTMCSGEGPETRIQGFSIAGGDGTMPTEEAGNLSQGGGFYLSGASPIIQTCLIVNNVADRGGAVYTEGGTPVFLDCWFYMNTSRAGGATIDCVRSRPRLLACGFHQDGIQWENTGSISVRSDCGVGGACCLRDVCIMSTKTACQDAGGFWQGPDLPCLESTCPPFCETDVNGDRRVNMTDVLLVLDDWGMCP